MFFNESECQALDKEGGFQEITFTGFGIRGPTLFIVINSQIGIYEDDTTI